LCVREAAPVLKIGRKGSAKKSVVEPKAALQIGDIVGQVQHGRGGFLAQFSSSGTRQDQLKGGSQRGAKAVGEDEVYKGHFPGQAGRVWNNARWAGKTFGRWKRVGSVSLSGQHMMFSHHHKT